MPANRVGLRPRLEHLGANIQPGSAQFDIGEVLRTAARLCGLNAGAFFGLALVGATPAWACTGLLVWLGEDSPALAMALTFAQSAALGAGFCWVQAGIVYRSVRALRDQPPTIVQTAHQALRRLPHVVAVYFLAYFAITLGFFLLVVPGVVLWLVLWAVVPAAVVEGRVGSAFRRSHELTNGHKWRLLGLLAVGVFASLCLGVVFAALAWEVTDPLVVLAGVGIMQVVLWIGWSAVFAASYYHLRLAAESGPGDAALASR